MKICTIVGARPQFIKAAALSRVLRKEHEEVLIHTGQHYDHNMSDIFFDELSIPRPDYNLGISGGSHGKMTGEMLIAIEKEVLQKLAVQPDFSQHQNQFGDWHAAEKITKILTEFQK